MNSLVAGIIQSLLCAVCYEEMILWPPIGRPISGDFVDDLLDSLNVDAVTCTLDFGRDQPVAGFS